MTWRETVVIQILLLVAKMVTDNAAVRNELHTLATHISVTGTRQVFAER